MGRHELPPHNQGKVEPMASGRKQTQNPESIAAPLKGYYSNAVKVTAGPLLFISGQVSVGPDGQIVGAGDLRAQAEQVLENIGAILAANNVDFSDVVKVLVYVTDIRAFDELTESLSSYSRKSWMEPCGSHRGRNSSTRGEPTFDGFAQSAWTLPHRRNARL